MQDFNAIIQYIASSKTRVTVIIFFLLSVGVFTTVSLTQQSQDIRQRASTTASINTCADCTGSNSQNTLFCRDATGQTTCQATDISADFPGAVCIDCKTATPSSRIAEESAPNLIEFINRFILNTFDQDKNGRITITDAEVIIRGIFTPSN